MAQAQQGALQAARQNALVQARSLHGLIRNALEQLTEREARRGTTSKDLQLECVNSIIGAVTNGLGNLTPALQNVVFKDILTVDNASVALNEWDQLLSETFEILKEIKGRLHQAPLKQFAAYTAIQDFMQELHKVVSRCILRVGQLAPTGN